LIGVAIRQVDGLAGPPWERPLNGVLDKLVVESEVLAGNPLGDPFRRPLYAYRSPGVVAGSAAAVQSIYLLQSFSGQLDAWLARDSFEPTRIERFDALYGPEAEPLPDCVLVFVDAWTSLGGSQFLNSSATGDYTDYICDEVVPFIDRRYPTGSEPALRSVTGHSSGGYGAMVLPMLRPDVFGALAAQAGDSLFEVCYQPDFRKAARVLRDAFGGSVERFRAELQARESFDWSRFGDILNVYAMAAAYSPDPDRSGHVMLPFEIATGQLIEDVWALWLAHDPVRMARGHAQALSGLRQIYLEAGRSDEYYLDLGAQAFGAELDKLGVAHTLTLFAGRHGGISHRYPIAVRELLRSV
jgi:S-formylglutathione hydrolase FrmB